ncbi:MAG TPA: cation transporting ATPase C-terminal domain-containing protein, partial [Micromonosporaceae bacterium]|nr:cation transporting ATPase C-terminal domain-containing protein [Micromonosporaceae bacterium]
VSVLLVGGSWWLFTWELDHGRGLDAARTATVNLIVVVEAFYLFNCRSLTRSAWRLGLFSNRWLIGGLIVQGVAQLALTYLPAMNRLFKTAPLGLDAWLRILGIALLASLAVGAEKSLQRRRSRRRLAEATPSPTASAKT